MLLLITLYNDPNLPLLPKPQPVSAGHSILSRVHVRIDNHLGNGEALTVHCKAGDSDKGVQRLGEQQSYDFGFKAWFTRLYFCGLTWSGGNAEFDAYKYDRDHERCDKWCIWEAKKEGIFGYRSHQDAPDIAINWNQ